MLDLYKHDLTHVARDGNNGLHFACDIGGFKEKDADITWLLDHCPELVSRANKRGRLPPHIAARTCGDNLCLEMFQ
jgi:hypothetical protein